MVKDEADIIGHTLERMAPQLDGVIVADNLSTDATPSILRDIADRFPHVELVCDDEPGYEQSRKMTALAMRAAAAGAQWVVPFDADEVWWHPSGRLADVLREVPEPHVDIVEVPLFDHVATASDPDRDDPIKRLVFYRKQPCPLPKVAARVRPGLVIEQGNHGAHYPGPVVREGIGARIDHYPYRTAVQMARKAQNGAAAYLMAGTKVRSTDGQHWRDYGRFYEQGGQEAIDEIFETWFWSDDPVNDPALVYGPCPL